MDKEKEKILVKLLLIGMFCIITFTAIYMIELDHRSQTSTLTITTYGIVDHINNNTIYFKEGAFSMWSASIKEYPASSTRVDEYYFPLKCYINKRVVVITTITRNYFGETIDKNSLLTSRLL